MATAEKTIYVCQSCGSTYPKWSGKCVQCGEWNTLTEEKQKKKTQRQIDSDRLGTVVTRLDKIETSDNFRVPTALGEFDRVIGGGLVAGASLLLGGDPGIGKSTLLLQTAGSLALNGQSVLYVSGEESAEQIKNRADRLGIMSDRVTVATTTEMHEIKAIIDREYHSFVIIDSIQTLRSREYESSPGTVTQIRECVAVLQDICSARGMCLLLIGHITKEGAIAGPKVLEHMVDVVLYFEGEKNHLYRILRAEKNRFGSTSEIGIFTIGGAGLEPVANPSQLFLSERTGGISGQAIVCSVEGARPILFEIQALVADSSYGVSQRVSSGFDQKRLSLLLAILEKKQGFRLAGKDVFVNLAGGLRIDEPAIDLGVMSAIVSSHQDTPVRSDSVLVGEVGLGGEIRSVPKLEARIKEAINLGFSRIVVPNRGLGDLKSKSGIKIVPVSTLDEAFRAALE
ncbi:MAG: DNA repair protein RadA [candidate division Zixibacteria bacterium]|nr:DNA repair protein RadA [candidate division Zixibacteria bacterium]MBU1469385.1 DNA repair protein RadA [candidate division Zixibacteria bacterium]MBU2626056.1 DNA repair protein RadA [candidate division Zixibacteria bacterium]